MKDKKKKTVHVHRTIMFQELEKVMDFGIELDTYTNAMEANSFGKKSADGINQTSNFLFRIYLFDPKVDSFKVFKYFWKIASEDERTLLVFLFSFTQDHLLFESAQVIAQTPLKEKVTLEGF